MKYDQEQVHLAVFEREPWNDYPPRLIRSKRVDLHDDCEMFDVATAFQFSTAMIIAFSSAYPFSVDTVARVQPDEETVTFYTNVIAGGNDPREIVTYGWKKKMRGLSVAKLSLEVDECSEVSAILGVVGNYLIVATTKLEDSFGFDGEQQL